MKRFIKFLLKSIVFVLVVGLFTAGGYYFGKLAGISEAKQENTSKYMERQDPVDLFEDQPLNFVLIGSDSRDGEANAKIGGSSDDGMRADTTMIAHVSADRKHIELVSIPRDSIVNIPSCVRSDGSNSEELTEVQFNWAFSQGDTPSSAAVCTMRTIELNTGVPMGGFAVVDFAGFENVVDAMGGVEMNIPEAMVSKKAKLNLEPGLQNLNGAEALGYARARTFESGGTSDGSDLSRIDRQQELLKAIAVQSFSLDVLSSPTKLYKMAEAILNDLTMSPELANLKDMVGFTFSLKDYETLEFTTVPNEPWSEDPNRVVWTAEAEALWTKLGSDLYSSSVTEETPVAEETVEVVPAE